MEAQEPGTINITPEEAIAEFQAIIADLSTALASERAVRKRQGRELAEARSIIEALAAQLSQQPEEGGDHAQEADD